MENKNNQQPEGFSSQQQQQNICQINNNQENLQQTTPEKSRVKAPYEISPPEDIRKKQYSLQPDMLTGWKPKIYLPKPIPLIFYNDQLDYFIQILIKMKTYPPTQQNVQQNKPFVQLVYLGPRYQSTYSAWYQKPFPFPYTHLNKNKRLKFTDRQFVGQYWHAETQNHLHFDSFFQSGNLQAVFKVKQFEYDLFMRVDSNTMGHLHWYNFKVKNMKKGVTYKYNLCNFLKAKSLYSRGMKPFVHSKRKYQLHKIGWQQVGQNIQYEKKIPKSFKILKKEADSKQFCLSFDFDCQFQNDEVQFSYCVPYQYSRLQEYIQQIKTKYQGKNYIKISRLTHSLGGLDIPIITITSDLKQKNHIDLQNKQQKNQSSKQQRNQPSVLQKNGSLKQQRNLKPKLQKNAPVEHQIVNKKLIVASGRIHPGQSNGSFMIQGFIDYICSDTDQSKQLRDSMVFKIIPMLNPDGVVLGNYRTSLSGKDLNRQFINPDRQIFPQVYHLKKYLGKLHSVYKKDFFMYLDFHGHSTKKNCFTYGPQFPITNSNYYESRILPKIISMKTEMFRYFSCIFKISQFKEQTLRAVLLKEFELDLVYTIQVSNGCFYDKEELKDIQFDDNKWIQMGNHIGKSISEYFMVIKQIQRFKIRKKQQRLNMKKNRQKIRLKTALMRRQNKLFSKQKQRTSLHSSKSHFYSKSKQYEFGDVRNKSFYKNNLLQFTITSSSLSKNIARSINQHKQSQDDFMNVYQMMPNFQNQNINSLIKSLYVSRPKKLSNNQQNSCQKLQQRFGQEDRYQKCSDDNISEGGSDSSSPSQDLNSQYKNQLFNSIKTGTQKLTVFYLKNKRHKNKEKNHLTQYTEFNQFDQNLQQQNVRLSNYQGFLTQASINQMNELQGMQSIQKINSIKLNELRSKRHIYLKKKSYQMNMSGSPKRQSQNIKTAKIINFEFSLNEIKPSTYGFNQKQQYSNSIHSLAKQTSQQKINQRSKQSQFLQFFPRNYSQFNHMLKYQQQLIQRKQRISSLSLMGQRQREIKVGLNGRQVRTFSRQRQIHVTNYPKQNYFSLLKRTQQRRPAINSTFYKNHKPSKNIDSSDVRGKRIFSSDGMSRSKTQITQY